MDPKKARPVPHSVYHRTPAAQPHADRRTVSLPPHVDHRSVLAALHALGVHGVAVGTTLTVLTAPPGVTIEQIQAAVTAPAAIPVDPVVTAIGNWDSLGTDAKDQLLLQAVKRVFGV